MTLIKEIKKWLRDYEKLTGEAYGDDLDEAGGTLEGGAYTLLSHALAELKRIKKGGI